MNAAHLHLVFNHHPAGCLVCAVVLSGAAWWRDNRGQLAGALICRGMAAWLRRYPGRNVRIPAAVVCSMACSRLLWLAVLTTVGGG